MPVSFPPPPDTVAAPGLYSHIAVGRGEEVIAFSGQTGRKASGEFDEGDVGAQAQQAFATIGELLKAAGAEWSSVISLRTYVVGTDNLPGYRAAREQIYADIFPDGPYPANTMLVVAGLGRPEALVEIEALAVR